MKFRPLHDRVVVKRVDAEEKTKGGIIIPDTAKEKPQEGEGSVRAGAGGAGVRLFDSRLKRVKNSDAPFSWEGRRLGGIA